jgi:phosphatidylglycerophosphatase A
LALSTSPDAPIRPGWRFVLSNPAHFIAFGFGSGLFPRSPGTAGTLVAFPLYWLITPFVNTQGYLIILLWAFALGVWVCDKTGRDLGEPDHGGMVWDEIVAFLLVLFFTPFAGALIRTPSSMFWNVLAFSLFRFFDIVKPPPISYFDRRWHNGMGVMFDDILAAGYTLLCMAIVKSWLIKF